MNLKESYQYMNFLEGTLSLATIHLQDKSFITESKEIHYKSKSNPDAADEEIIIKPEYDSLDCTPNDLIDICMEILTEKELVSLAIHDAKKSTAINIDHSISMNIKIQDFIRKLNNLAKVTSKESTNTGYGYKFNAEGNETSYRYDITKITTINYDRVNVKKLIKKLTKKCDETSKYLDRVQIETELDFKPKWSTVDTLEDIIEQYKTNK